nr:hypothetical protein [Tanacetum cinerariifolium]
MQRHFARKTTLTDKFLDDEDWKDYEVHQVLVGTKDRRESQEEVHSSWLAAKDARRGEHGRLDGLNEVIDNALEEIERLETNVEILEGVADVVVSGCVFCCLELGEVWARCQVGKSLKAGFVTDLEVQK